LGQDNDYAGDATPQEAPAREKISQTDKKYPFSAITQPLKES